MVKVDVYKNLQRDCISVKSRENESYGKVIEYADEVHIVNAEFVVQPSGRQRVIEKERKNVHAFVRGQKNDSRHDFDNATEITYNPYKYSSFVTVEEEEPVTSAKQVIVTTNGVLAKDVILD